MGRGIVILGTGAVILALLVLVRWSDAGPVGAQTTPDAAPTEAVPFRATLIAEAEVGVLAAGEMTLNATSYVFPPGTEAQPITATGPVLIRVQAGAITLDADLAAVSPVVPEIGVLALAQPTPTAATGLVVAAGQQILLPTGTTARLANEGAEPATLIVIAILVEAGATPAA
jgi:hypothetical protein